MRVVSPMDASQVTFGVELETTIPRDATSMNGGLIRIGGHGEGRGYTMTAEMGAPMFEGRGWRADSDGSIAVQTTGHTGCEFVSPVLRGEAGVAHLVAMIDWLNSIGAKVNTSCGVHIHIGIASVLGDTQTPAVTASWLLKLASVVNANAVGIYAQTGTRRDMNQYCAPLTEATRVELRRQRDAGRVNGYETGSRYRILNLCNATTERGTVEFRAFAGTVSADKVLHHLWTCLYLVLFAKQLKAAKWTTANWSSKQGGEGERAVRGLHQKMAKHCKLGEIGNRCKTIRTEAIRLARKFDATGAVRSY